MVTSPSNSPQPPQVGTLIDNGALELVEVLGYGGYGIVYRAIDTFSSNPTSYAVKCLPHSTKRNAARQRQLHIREITLHQLASAHPGVVTLHRVIEDSHFTWIVMDYCPDGDLFTQILHNRRYLGNNELIKNVFLQLLDAVEYCHSLNIYHRDLKPENILCFDDGLRLAITDFGLATTERMSTEFRTGSVYHMSPECQGGEFAPTRSYSPLFNDIWSLGIILLNLITGRNPWKSASADDCTFQAYLKDPDRFLPTVLPISDEVNALLVRVLEVDWRHRLTLREMRQAVKGIRNFYSDDVLFEDSMARCPWEAGVHCEEDDEESASAEPEPVQEVIPEPQPEVVEDEFLDTPATYNTQWGTDGDSDMHFVQPSTQYSDYDYSSVEKADAAHDSGRSMSPSPSLSPHRRFARSRTPGRSSMYSLVSSMSSIPSPPLTPGPEEDTFANAQRRPAHLTINVTGLHSDMYPTTAEMLSATSSMMHTAIDSSIPFEYNGRDPYESFLYTESEKMVTSPMDVAMAPTEYEDYEDDMDGLSSYDYPTADHYDARDAPDGSIARQDSQALGLDLFPASSTTAVDASFDATSTLGWSTVPSRSSPSYSFLTFDTATSPTSSQVPTFSFGESTLNGSTSDKLGSTLGSSFLAHPAAQSTPAASSQARSRSRSRSRSRKSRLLNPVRLAFTRRSRSPSPLAHSGNADAQAEHSASTLAQQQFVTHWTLSTSISPNHPPALSCFASPAHSPSRTPPAGAGASTSVQEKDTLGMRRRNTKRRLRSAKDWFSPGRLFAAVMPSP
ncbi:kinase-like protein [Phanerochaete sordida]|uniref:Kinase-like protein n=1 Tax=Phanerochaete sordida TaxID=48140 RepID=A0A9P3GH21_9APHY|nr:kinase-like protein [Phanerochaete sordida]